MARACQRCGSTEGHTVEWHPTPGVVQSAWFCPHCWARERAEREEMVAMLRAIEERDADDGMACLACEPQMVDGVPGETTGHRHAPDCRLAAFLGGGRS